VIENKGAFNALWQAAQGGLRTRMIRSFTEMTEDKEKSMTTVELADRLKNLEDMEAIRAFHHEYLFCLNKRQWDDMAECFIEDAFAHIHQPCQGKEEIRKLFTERISQLNSGKGRDAHFAVEPVIRVKGDRAEGHWLIYILISDPDTGGASRWIPGRYDCEYSRTEKGWRFSSLVYTSPWP
jgi:ketosteroid isomerase-like protein